MARGFRWAALAGMSRPARWAALAGMSRPIRWAAPAVVSRPFPRATLAVAIAACLGSTACGPADGPPAEPPIDGEHAYTVRCGYCHDVPNGIGAALTPRVLVGYGTVGGLDRYLRFAMPHEAPGSLPSGEYAAILGYLIESRELVEGDADARELAPATELRLPEGEAQPSIPRPDGGGGGPRPTLGTPRSDSAMYPPRRTH